MMGVSEMVLPPGFIFDPTDEELIVQYLHPRAASLRSHPNMVPNIPDLEYHVVDPWELKEKAFSTHNEWYFFTRLNKNRRTKKGFWKEQGFSETILTRNGNEVGVKKYLVFCPNEEALSNAEDEWIMKEYHLFKSGKSVLGENQIQRDMNEWVLCRVHEGNVDSAVSQDRSYQCLYENNYGDGIELSYLDEVYLGMDDDDQEETSFPN